MIDSTLKCAPETSTCAPEIFSVLKFAPAKTCSKSARRDGVVDELGEEGGFLYQQLHVLLLQDKGAVHRFHVDGRAA